MNIRRQAPLGQYVVDFVSHAAALVIELDGPWHDLPEAQLHDLERDAWLKSQGYRVVRFKNDEALADAPGVAERIRMLIESNKALPLDGGGLGGGAQAGVEGRFGEASPAFLSSFSAASPPSPTVRPSRGRGQDTLRPSSIANGNGSGA